MEDIAPHAPLALVKSDSFLGVFVAQREKIMKRIGESNAKLAVVIKEWVEVCNSHCHSIHCKDRVSYRRDRLPGASVADVWRGTVSKVIADAKKPAEQDAGAKTQGEQPALRLINANANPPYVPVTHEDLTALSTVLDDSVHALMMADDRLKSWVLPKPHHSVSNALGIDTNVITDTARNSDDFTFERLIRGILGTYIINNTGPLAAGKTMLIDSASSLLEALTAESVSGAQGGLSRMKFENTIRIHSPAGMKSAEEAFTEDKTATVYVQVDGFSVVVLYNAILAGSRTMINTTGNDVLYVRNQPEDRHEF